MSTYLTVTTGIDMRSALGKERLTKKWLRDYLRDHPEKDFRVLTHGVRGPVNGENVIDLDLTLQVVAPNDPGTVVANVNFQRVEGTEWGYQAVVS